MTKKKDEQTITLIPGEDDDIIEALKNYDAKELLRYAIEEKRSPFDY